jgi:hypothetical protein
MAESEAKPELPIVSPIEAPDFGGQAAPAEAKDAVRPAIEAAKSEMPAVEPPKLDAREQALRAAVEMAAFRSSEAARKKTAAGLAAMAAPRFSRFGPLAAVVILTAALGSMAGSLSASGLARLWSSAPASSTAMEANALQAIKTELAELNALKASLDGATRSANGQFVKLADRLDRVERGQAEPAAKITHMSEALDRLEKKSTVAAAAAPETTGSIGASPPQAVEATKSDKMSPDKVLQDWVVQDVRKGHALVASRFGGVFEVAVGTVLPGLGRIEEIKRQDGQWVVMTARGLITEH